MAAAAQPQAPAAPFTSPSTLFQPVPQYNYAAAIAAQDRERQIDRTKTGLLLLIIGTLISPIPYIQIIGGILDIIGAILVIVGRNAFGTLHARNTIWSIVIYVIGLAVLFAGAIAFGFAVASATLAGIGGGTVNSTAIGQSLSSAFNLLLILAAVGGAISGIAEVLFTYGLQNQVGKILLWTGYAAAVAVSIIEFVIISPLIQNAVSQSFTRSTFDPTALNDLQSQLRTLGLLSFIPAIIWASAFYLAWSRINTRQIPFSSQQPSPIIGPPM
jgi:hypothetical protein